MVKFDSGPADAGLAGSAIVRPGAQPRRASEVPRPGQQPGGNGVTPVSPKVHTSIDASYARRTIAGAVGSPRWTRPMGDMTPMAVCFKPSGPLSLGRSGRLARPVRIVALGLAALAFINLVPNVDAIKSGGTTIRGAIEIAMLSVATMLAASVASARVALRLATGSLAFWATVGLSAWAAVTALWSPNPFLSLAKSFELILIACCSVAMVSIPTRSFRSTGDRAQLADDVALAMLGSIVVLLIVNIYIYKNPLAIVRADGDVAPWDAAVDTKRARLIFAYAPPLLAGDLIALLAICLATSSASAFWRLAGLVGAGGLLVLTDARTALIAVPAALGVVWITGLFRRSVLVIMAVAATLVALIVCLTNLGTTGSLTGNQELDGDLLSVSGRMELWTYSWPIILDNWVTGIGFYGSRYVLIPRWFWAGHTHHSLIEVALCLGIVGVAFFGAFLACACVRAASSRDRLLIGVLSYSLIVGNINPIIMDPTLPMFLLLSSLFQSEVDDIRERMSLEGDRLFPLAQIQGRRF